MKKMSIICLILTIAGSTTGRASADSIQAAVDKAMADRNKAIESAKDNYDKAMKPFLEKHGKTHDDKIESANKNTLTRLETIKKQASDNKDLAAMSMIKKYVNLIQNPSGLVHIVKPAAKEGEPKQTPMQIVVDKIMTEWLSEIRKANVEYHNMIDPVADRNKRIFNSSVMRANKSASLRLSIAKKQAEAKKDDLALATITTALQEVSKEGQLMRLSTEPQVAIVGSWRITNSDKTVREWTFKKDGSVLLDGDKKSRWNAEENQISVRTSKHCVTVFKYPIRGTGTQGDNLRKGGRQSRLVAMNLGSSDPSFLLRKPKSNSNTETAKPDGVGGWGNTPDVTDKPKEYSSFVGKWNVYLNGQYAEQIDIDDALNLKVTTKSNKIAWSREIIKFEKGLRWKLKDGHADRVMAFPSKSTASYLIDYKNRRCVAKKIISETVPKPESVKPIPNTTGSNSQESLKSQIELLTSGVWTYKGRVGSRNLAFDKNGTGTITEITDTIRSFPVKWEAKEGFIFWWRTDINKILRNKIILPLDPNGTKGKQHTNREYIITRTAKKSDTVKPVPTTKPNESTGENKTESTQDSLKSQIELLTSGVWTMNGTRNLTFNKNGSGTITNISSNSSYPLKWEAKEGFIFWWRSDINKLIRNKITLPLDPSGTKCKQLTTNTDSIIKRTKTLKP